MLNRELQKQRADLYSEELKGSINPSLEIKFKEISVPVVKNYKGLISLEIGRPTKWNPQEFIMISLWETEKDLIEFAGQNWNEAHIPKGMEKFISECSVSHYESIVLNTA